MTAASENGQTPEKYLNLIVKEHLNKVDNQSAFERTYGKNHPFGETGSEPAAPKKSYKKAPVETLKH